MVATGNFIRSWALNTSSCLLVANYPRAGSTARLAISTAKIAAASHVSLSRPCSVGWMVGWMVGWLVAGKAVRRNRSEVVLRRWSKAACHETLHPRSLRQVMAAADRADLPRRGESREDATRGSSGPRGCKIVIPIFAGGFLSPSLFLPLPQVRTATVQ